MRTSCTTSRSLAQSAREIDPAFVDDLIQRSTSDYTPSTVAGGARDGKRWLNCCSSISANLGRKVPVSKRRCTAVFTRSTRSPPGGFATTL
jgi:hypothetical protein